MERRLTSPSQVSIWDDCPRQSRVAIPCATRSRVARPCNQIKSGCFPSAKSRVAAPLRGRNPQPHGPRLLRAVAQVRRRLRRGGRDLPGGRRLPRGHAGVTATSPGCLVPTRSASTPRWPPPGTIFADSRRVVLLCFRSLDRTDCSHVVLGHE